MIARRLKPLLASPFAKALTVYLTTAIIGRAISLLSFALLGKFLLPAQYAQLTAFNFASDMAVVFVGFGFGSSIMRTPEKERLESLNASLWMILAFGAVAIVALWLTGMSPLGELPEEYRFLRSMPIEVVLRSINQAVATLFSMYYVSCRQPGRFAKVQVTSNLIVLIALSLYFFSTSASHIGEFDTTVVIRIFVACNLLSTVVVLYSSRDLLRISGLRRNAFTRCFKTSSPFFLKSGIGVLQTYASRLILLTMAVSSIVGVYSYYTTLFMQLAFVMSVFTQAYIPKVRHLLEQGPKELNAARAIVRKTSRMYGVASSLAFIVGVGVAILLFEQRAFFSRVIHIEYLEHIEIGVLLLVWFLVGNVRTFFDVWQYLPNVGISQRIVLSNLGWLGLLFGLGIIGFKLFGVTGVVLSQIIVVVGNGFYSYRMFHRYSRAIERAQEQAMAQGPLI